MLLIGGKSVCRHPDLQLVLNVTGTIETTDRNAYADINRLEQKAAKNVGKYDIMVLALGQAGRVLGYRLWRNAHRTQILDIGSVIDALADRPLRSWIQRNLGVKAMVLERFSRSTAITPPKDHGRCESFRNRRGPSAATLAHDFC